MWKFLKTPLVGKVIRAGYSLMVGVDSALQTAVSFLTQGKLAAGLAGLGLGVTEMLGAWFFQGKSIAEHFDPKTAEQQPLLPVTAETASQHTAASRVTQCTSASTQTLALLAKSSAIATDRFYAWVLIDTLLRLLCIGSLTGAAFWAPFGVSLTIALTTKGLAVDGYSLAQGIAAYIEKNPDAKPILAPFLRALQEEDGLRKSLEMAMTVESVVMEELLPFIALMVGFQTRDIPCDLTDNPELEKFRRNTAITTGIAVLLAPFMLLQTWVFDARRAFEDSVDNAMGHRDFVLPEAARKISCGNQYLTGFFAKTTPWVSSIARPGAMGINNFLALGLLGVAAEIAAPIAVVMVIFLALGNKFSEGAAVEDQVVEPVPPKSYEQIIEEHNRAQQVINDGIHELAAKLENNPAAITGLLN